MSPAPSASKTVALLGLLLSFLIVGAGPAGATTSASRATDTATPDSTPGSTPGSAVGGTESGPAGSPAGGDLPIDVQVTDLLPELPRPGDVVQVKGRLVDRGAQPVSTLRLQLRLGQRIDSRSGLAAADTQTPEGAVRVAELEPAQPVLLPGQSTTFDLRVPVAQLGLYPASENGVYPFQLEARGLVAGAGVRDRVGFTPTYLPWFGSRSVEPTRLAWLLPLVDAPRLGPKGELVDDSLSASFAPGGRLAGLLATGRAGEKGQCLAEPQRPPDAKAPATRPAERERCGAVPVTYGVDPDLLVTAQTLAAPYRLADDPARAERHPASSAAATWLSDLRAAAGSGAVLALPYADPDVVALTRPRSGLGGDLASAGRAGDDVVQTATGSTPLADVAWPPAGRLTSDAVDAAGGQSGGALILDESALGAPAQDVGRTPGTRVALPSSAGAPQTGLVVDAGLSALLGRDPAQWHGSRLAQQRFLAETAIIAAERPNESRTLLVAPDRRGAVDVSAAAGDLLDTGRLPWLCPVALADVVGGRESCADRTAASNTDSAPEPGHGVLLAPVDRKGELDPSYVRRVSAVRDKALQLTGSVLLPGTEQTAATRTAMLRAVFRTESSAWRDDEAGGDRLVDLLRSDVTGYTDKVRVLTGSVTLTSKSGSVSVDVQNTLDQPVTLRVDLSASNKARLSTQQTPLLEVPGRTSVPVAVRAEALTSGRFVVTAVLKDRDGNPFGQPAELQVRSTQYGSVALAITGVAAGVLLLAAGVRITRRALGRHGAAETA